MVDAMRKLDRDDDDDDDEEEDMVVTFFFFPKVYVGL